MSFKPLNFALSNIDTSKLALSKLAKASALHVEPVAVAGGGVGEASLLILLASKAKIGWLALKAALGSPKAAAALKAATTKGALAKGAVFNPFTQAIAANAKTAFGKEVAISLAKMVAYRRLNLKTPLSSILRFWETLDTHTPVGSLVTWASRVKPTFYPMIKLAAEDPQFYRGIAAIKNQPELWQVLKAKNFNLKAFTPHTLQTLFAKQPELLNRILETQKTYPTFFPQLMQAVETHPDLLIALQKAQSERDNLLLLLETMNVYGKVEKSPGWLGWLTTTLHIGETKKAVGSAEAVNGIIHLYEEFLKMKILEVAAS